MKRMIFAAALLTACTTANAAPDARVKIVTLDAAKCGITAQMFNPWNTGTNGDPAMRAGGNFWLTWFADSRQFYVSYAEDEQRNLTTGDPSPEMHSAKAGAWMTPERSDRRDVRFRWVSGNRVEIQADARKWQIYDPCEREDVTFVWPCDDARWVKLAAPYSARLCEATR